MSLLNEPSLPLLIFTSCLCLILLPVCIIFAFKLYRKATIFSVLFLVGLIFVHLSCILTSSVLVDKPRVLREGLVQGAIFIQATGGLLLSLAFIIRFNSFVPILSETLIVTANPHLRMILRKFIHLLPYCFGSVTLLLFLYFVASFGYLWSEKGPLDIQLYSPLKRSLIIFGTFVTLIDLLCTLSLIHLLFKQKTTIETGSHSLKKDKIAMLLVLFLEIFFAIAGIVLGFYSMDHLAPTSILSHFCFMLYVIPCSIMLILFRHGVTEVTSSQDYRMGQVHSSTDSILRKTQRSIGPGTSTGG
jgi:hypothetical protein